jgi:hypothetical protein
MTLFSEDGTHSVVGGCFAFCVTSFVFQALLRDTLIWVVSFRTFDMRGVFDVFKGKCT